MKVILYMAVTANGLIAKEDDDTSFVSEHEWKSFDKMSRKAGNLIVGRNTHECDVSDGLFPYPDRLNVIMTSKKLENKWGDQAIFTDKPPKEVLRMLKEKGFKTAFIAGGGKINASFMKENLIDEIYLGVEPVVFGKGIRLFADADFEAKLELIDVKRTGNEILLHYRVIK
jgi:dihydrofolate reductase